MGLFAARKKKAYSADSACKPVYLFLRLLLSVIKCFEGTGEVLLTAFDSAACKCKIGVMHWHNPY